uniref:B30.2/SPRY domain-containing protein n=1 Tax=Oryzias melastigma TaxID=30732 RepID=A0A3B3B485_ORYME
NEKLLSDYLHHVFPSAKPGATPQVDGRVGPQPVVLDHTSGFEGLLFVDDDLLGVIGHSNFSSIRATTCVYKGKWAYEVLISSQGLMQIGWCTLNCRFNQEEGVGDTPDSYAYDGNRVRKWNVTTTNYGKSWAAGDIVSCLVDLDEGTITFCLNGQSLGTAFTNIKMGPGIAYFPAISLSFKESVAFNFGKGYLPLQDPPTADLTKAHKLLGFIKNVLSTSFDTQVRAEAATRAVGTCSLFVSGVSAAGGEAAGEGLRHVEAPRGTHRTGHPGSHLQPLRSSHGEKNPPFLLA